MNARVPLLAAVLTSLLAPAPARAASVAIIPPSDPVIGLPASIGYAYETDNFPQQLTIISRPASGPPCAASPSADATIAGGSGTRYVTSSPVDVQGAGGDQFAFTFTEPEPTRICAWLYRNSVDEVTASAVQPVEPRRPRGSLVLQASQAAPKAGGSDILLTMTGESELSRDPLAMVIPAGDSCPAAFEEQSATTVLDRPGQTTAKVQGAFTTTFQTRELLAYRKWRVCAYLQDGPDAIEPLAIATTIVDFVLAPQVLRRPRVAIKNGRAICDQGRWKALPKARLSTAWLVNGQRVGKGLAIKVKKSWRKVTCKTTAKNRIGTTSASSRAVPVR